MAGSSDRSRDSADKGYVAIHFERGVPVLDRDLDLLGGLTIEQLRRVAEQTMSDGTAVDGFSIRALAEDLAPREDFLIGRGSFLVAGTNVRNQAELRYSDQTPAPPPLSPPTTGARVDRVYLEARIEEVDTATDPDLANPDDVGMVTSLRGRLVWTVRVAEGGVLDPSPDGIQRTLLAEIVREPGAGIEPRMIRDLRSRRFALRDLVQRLARLEQAFTPSIDQVTSGFDDVNRYASTLEVHGQRLFETGGFAQATATLGGVAVFLTPDPSVTPRFTPGSTRLRFALPASVPAGEAEFVVMTSYGEARKLVAVREQWEVLNTLATDVAAGPDTGTPPEVQGLPRITTLGTKPAGDDFMLFGWSWARRASDVNPYPTYIALSLVADTAGTVWYVNSTRQVGNINTSLILSAAADVAVDVAVAADGTAWRVQGTTVAFAPTSARWDKVESAWSSNKVTDLPVQGTKIAVDSSGAPWVVGGNGELYQYHSGPRTWQARGLTSVKDVDIGPDDVVWLLAGDKLPGGYTVLSLRKQGLVSSGITGMRITVDDHGVPWVVDDKHVVRYRTLEVWSWP